MNDIRVCVSLRWKCPCEAGEDIGLVVSLNKKTPKVVFIEAMGQAWDDMQAEIAEHLAEAEAAEAAKLAAMLETRQAPFSWSKR